MSRSSTHTTHNTFRMTGRACRALALLVVLAGAARAEDWTPPDVLKEWVDEGFKQRIFIEVEAPGEAGNVGLLGDLPYASVLLPLKIADEGKSTARLEHILLLGEDGTPQTVAFKRVGSEVELLFRSRQGMRRFCLYSNFEKTEAQPAPRRVSPVVKEESPVRVKLRGRSAPASFVYAPDAPLTLERFQRLEESGENVLSVKSVESINHPETPYLAVSVNIFGAIKDVRDPRNYTALYDAVLRTPLAGKYAFSIDTLGAAHLVIDGVPVIQAPAPDERRAPFTLNGEVELSAGLHRVQLYYSEGGAPGAKSNAAQQKFGVRLHWKPPFTQDFMCIPPYSFVKSAGALVRRLETAKDYPAPYVQVERLGQVRSASHLGQRYESERVLVSLRALGVPPDKRILVTAPVPTIESYQENGVALVWIPAGMDVQVGLADVPEARTISFPAVTTANQAEALNLEGELSLKSVPDFLYPSETGHLHLEAAVSAPPILVYKERLESDLLPPAARPMGQYRLDWALTGAGNVLRKDSLQTTPSEGTRFKQRVSFDYPELEKLALNGSGTIVLQLSVGGVPVESQRVRVLPSWRPWTTGRVLSGAAGLYYTPRSDANLRLEDLRAPKPPAAASAAPDPNVLNLNDLERVMILVPEENEAEYRRFALLKRAARGSSGSAVFIGDPLAENVAANELHGLAKRLAELEPGMKWSAITIPGPQRHPPVFRILAALDAVLKNQEKPLLPETAVISLGGGDVARQTPLHAFERGVDALIDRLRVAGVRKIVFIGVLPEPFREEHARIYQERLSDVLRRHHTDGVDVLNAWIRESDWARRYARDPQGLLYGPVPNGAALEELAQSAKDRL